MFTGIIETLGKVTHLEPNGGNLNITLASKLTPQLKIDQSIAHNGVCLTVVSLSDTTYTVTAIAETLSKTNLNQLKVNDLVNLERAMILGSTIGWPYCTGACRPDRKMHWYKGGRWQLDFFLYI